MLGPHGVLLQEDLRDHGFFAADDFPRDHVAHDFQRNRIPSEMFHREIHCTRDRSLTVAARSSRGPVWSRLGLVAARPEIDKAEVDYWQLLLFGSAGAFTSQANLGVFQLLLNFRQLRVVHVAGRPALIFANRALPLSDGLTNLALFEVDFGQMVVHGWVARHVAQGFP